jgi:hypothetical protein
LVYDKENNFYRKIGRMKAKYFTKW